MFSTRATSFACPPLLIGLSPATRPLSARQLLTYSVIARFDAWFVRMSLHAGQISEELGFRPNATDD